MKTRLLRALAALAVLSCVPALPALAEQAPKMTSPADSLLYLNGLNHLFVVDPVTFKIVQDVPAHGLAQLLVPTPDLKTLYMVDGQRERIEVIDRATGKQTDALSFSTPGKAKARVYGMCISGDRLYVYLNVTRFDGYEANKIDRFHLAEPEIVVMDLKTKKRVGRLPMPLGILFLQAVGANHVYAIGRDIYDIDTRTLKRSLRYPLGEPPTEGEGAIIMYAEWVHPESAGDVAGYPY